MRKRLCRALLMILVTALSLLTASPTVAADDREFIPAADNPCGVDILLESQDSPRNTDHARAGYKNYTFTSVETGATFVQRSRGVPTFTFDASTETWEVTIFGRIWLTLFPGEPGPSGVVQEPGLWISTHGVLKYTLTNEDVLIAYSLKGSYTDICAELTD
jgi:hypothetical protein